MKQPALIVFLFAFTAIFAQDLYNTRSAKITFFSDAPIEDIHSENPNVNCLMNVKTGELVFKVIMTSFQFEKQAMKDHFNKDFVESAKYPEATFAGNVTNIGSIDLSKNGKHTVNVKGSLTIHGVKKAVAHPGTLEVKDGKIILSSKFNILLSDYKISVPNNYLKRISNTVQVTVSATLQPYQR